MEFGFVRHTSRLMIVTMALGFAQSAAAASLCGSSGDGNGDCRIALDDYADFSACMGGPGSIAPLECQCYDFDANGSVDLADAQFFHQDFTGTSLIAGCVLPTRPDEPGTMRPGNAGSPPQPVHEIPESTVTDSVYMFSGEYHLSATDLLIQGRGFDFEWRRRYRSKIGPNTTMGNGWDHSYNIQLTQSGANLVLHDGDGRSDEYCATSTGTWTHPEFFRELVPQGNGYSLTFQDRSTWNFNGFAGLPDDGKIASMIDRNGNRMTFEYDPGTGRLTGIRDTLDSAINSRLISIAYNADGYIQSVTDFAGRQIVYDYYQTPDVGGDAGDLKSVTTPPIVGTPNGNDFPLGKTTIYTYSEGFADPRLNHNLLTITDPKGQTFLVNTYAATLNPNDLEYDRLVSQQLGNPNELLTFSYDKQTPSVSNNFATSVCYANDRVGNVEECFYDYRNRLAMKRRYTGRANPLLPTTSAGNRPVNPLRPSDPPFFETRYEYNDESLLTRVIAPELNEIELIYEGDRDLFAPQRRRCELRERSRIAGLRGASQPVITEYFDYDPTINGDSSQVTLWVDGRGNVTHHFYDPRGNRTQTVGQVQSVVNDYEYNTFGQLTLHRHPDNGTGARREDTFNYFPQAAGPQYGYLESETIDATGFSLTTAYEYDSVGNITRTIDPKGNDTQYVYNQHDEIVQSLSREVVPGVGPRYESLFFYDENSNLVRVDKENRDSNGIIIAGNPYFTTEYQFDILNCITQKTEEVDPGNSVVTEYEYDGNRNRRVIRSGESTNGNQPDNTVTRIYDERDLVFQTIRASGNPSESTDQYDYDANGIITLHGQGLQGLTPAEETYAYDGHNRLTIKGTSFGNASLFDYDAGDNVVQVIHEGELVDVPGNASNVRLSETTFGYDPINRLTIRGDKFFDSAQNPITDGESTTQYIYSDSSHVIQVIDDNSHSMTCIFDSANRRSSCTDAKGNTIQFIYDSNSNLIGESTVEKSDLGLPDEQFTQTYDYDGLNRITLKGDSFGNTRFYDYDSRDLVTEEKDPLGNQTLFIFDGLNRLVQSDQILTSTGAGGGPVIGVITNIQTWDDSSRLTSQQDGNGNTTNYHYDPLNRVTQTDYADGTSSLYWFDERDNRILHVDANGTQIDYSYDLENRLSGKVITAGPGVSTDTTFEQYEYDGLDRLVFAADDDSTVSRVYDSLSNVVNETQNGVVITSTYDGMSNQTSCVYPGGRTIDYVYDDLDRVSNVSDAFGPISSCLYVGPDRQQFRNNANGTTSTIFYDGISGVPNRPGDFGAKLPATIIHEHPASGSVIDVRDFKWDPQYNKKIRNDKTNQIEHAYEYDSAFRLTRTVKTDTVAPAIIRDTQYQLDTVGNRLFVLNDNCPGAYTMNAGSPPADFQMNQYSGTGCDGRIYDQNGNMIERGAGGPPIVMDYDYKDRLITHNDPTTGTISTYAYDALDRRITTKENTAIFTLQTNYFYDGYHVIEESDNTGNTATFVYGGGLDELIQMQRGAVDFYYHTDDMGNVMALTDAGGFVVERYEYQDFGEPEFFDTAGVSIPASLVRNPYLFTGRRYDEATGLYYNRNRYLDPISGRFITRDPLGAWADSLNGGNAYTYGGNNPWTNSDPFGFMNKGELIDAIATSGGLAKWDQLSMVETASISKRAARTGRNPQTGKEIKIAAKNVVRFKAGSELSEKVNMAGGGGNSCPA
ncbi:MAG TPA: RHS repeat-associated core domain-containing protein, partial [Phycisphaerae bacterium]|nr:RHS repeat-associated core domain-containing protein [Phycisphaerae bacterium]